MTLMGQFVIATSMVMGFGWFGLSFGLFRIRASYLHMVHVWELKRHLNSHYGGLGY